MILLADNYLLFELASGERVPFSAEMISVELAAGEDAPFDAEFLRHATKAVFHYFRTEARRDWVTFAEFSAALEKVLRGFASDGPVLTSAAKTPEPSLGATDLRRLADESGSAELLFFARLREELRRRLRETPRVLHFRGLRGCVKQLAGARRWSPRCRRLQDRIVEYLRACAARDTAGQDCALVVE